jgi:hypothetical protein
LSVAGSDLSSSFDLNRIGWGGVANLLIEVGGYNGEAADDLVQVGLMLSAGITARLDPSQRLDAGPDAPGPPTLDVGSIPPVWDGGSLEEWSPDVIDTTEAGAPKFISPGYVNEGVLVVEIPEVVIPFGGGSVPVNGARLSGDLRPVDGGYTLEHGRLVGRVRTSAFLFALGASKYGTLRLCERPNEFAAAKSAICNQADLSDVDGGPCNELSMGVTFIGVPATFAGVPARARIGPRYGCGEDFAPECEHVLANP